jgi:adenine-specific DNA-methyltransferase
MGTHTVDFPKPVELIEDIVKMGASEGDTILDFFAGSGTTAHAVMELNKKDGGDWEYVLIEMGDYFDSVIRPRIQKLALSLDWDDGVPQTRDGQSHMVRYHRLESYEDALNNVVLEEPEDEQQQRLVQDQREEYVSGYMLDFEAEGPSLLEPVSFDHPFDHELEIEQNGTSREPTRVDLVETFHYLLGAEVNGFEAHEHQGRQYVVTRCSVEMENSIDNVLTVWRDTEDLDLEQEREWFEEQFESGEFDRIYINTDSFVPDAEPVEVTFKERMEAGHDGAE